MAATSEARPVPGTSPSRSAEVQADAAQAHGRDGGRLARILSLVIVAGALVWLSAVVPKSTVLALYELRVLAQGVMDGERYEPQMMSDIDAAATPLLLDQPCNATGLQDLSVIKAALAIMAIDANDPDGADQRLTEAEASARRSAACNPYSGVSWTVLAWVEYIRNENTPRLASLLEMAYRTAPFEYWSLQLRINLLLYLYPKIDDEETRHLRRLLNWLLLNGYPEALGGYYVTSAAPQRGFIRDILAEAEERDQKIAAEVIRRRGEDIDLPLVPPQGSRPWN